eukprot:m.74895 g.74895  ORF g.74895 m.74895 type:complete len:296 (+) comp13114_c5_seq1:250-1137(+)
MSSSISGVRIAGIEKRLVPKVQFVYVVEVAWTNGSKHVILRSFRDIYKFHVKLLELFPLEAGEYEGSTRTIPLLPGKRKQGKTRDKAQKILPEIAKYLDALVRVDPKIATCEYVLRFFSMNSHDHKFADLIRTVQAHADPVTGLILNASEFRERNATLSRTRRETMSKPTKTEVREGFICAVVAQRDSVDYFKSTQQTPLKNVLQIPERLSYTRGDTLLVTSMNDCPAGHWRCRTAAGVEGYVPSADVAIDPTLLKARLTHIVGVCAAHVCFFFSCLLQCYLSLGLTSFLVIASP